MSLLDVTPAQHFGPPRESFFDPTWFERDLDAVFVPRWHFAGHVDELAEPGAYFLYTIGRYEVIVCRRSDGGIAAYHNFCRHRGYRLVTERRGKLRRNLACGYHGWTFARDSGDCLSATRMPEGFDLCEWSLRRAWVEDFHGLVFVCLAETAPEPVASAAAHLLDSTGGVSGYDLDRMRVAATDEWTIKANWKVVKENDDECYHCALNHPELARSYDPWSGMTVSGGADADLDAQWTTKDWAKIELGRVYTQGRVCEIPLPRTDGPGRFDAEEVQIFWLAGGHVIFVNDYARLSSFVPLGPELTLVQYWWFVDKDAVEGRDYDRANLMELLNVTSQQDTGLCEEVQRGVRMPAYTPGPLNLEHQTPAAAFYRWYERQLASRQ
jgi:phenylpropionate dioxygenase-like ring-hydroxylating dioxygenase large terminal subunit